MIDAQNKAITRSMESFKEEYKKRFQKARESLQRDSNGKEISVLLRQQQHQQHQHQKGVPLRFLPLHSNGHIHESNINSNSTKNSVEDDDDTIKNMTSKTAISLSDSTRQIQLERTVKALVGRLQQVCGIYF